MEYFQAFFKEKMIDDFEKQFAAKRSLEATYGRVCWRQAFPDKMLTSEPVLFVPGWGATPDTYHDLFKHLYEKGLPIICPEPPHMLRKTVSFGGESRLSEKLGHSASQKVADVLTLSNYIRKKYSTEKIIALGHSIGALILTASASVDTDLFRNICLVSPAGCTKEETLNLMMKFSSMILGKTDEYFQDPEKNKSVIRTGLEAIKYVGLNPKRIEEAKAISTVSIVNLLRDLQTINHIPVSVLHGNNDDVFNPSEVQQRLEGFVCQFMLVEGMDHISMIHDRTIHEMINGMLRNGL
jgi:pimeloyl-ACP methyl ester carboxylesterase